MTGRIPDSFIQDLLARSDIVEIIGTRVELKRAGKELKGLSPFTHEKSPSFFVSPTKQMFFDFSSGKNGNAIGFLMEYDRLSFVEAVEELAGRLGLEIPREGGFSQRLVLDGPLDALAAAERYWRDQLKQAPAAVAYLKKRGVNGETAKTFGLGYAPESWDALTKLFPDPKHALEAGLLIEREGREGAYDRFRNRIMFPIRDTRGRVIGFGGRTLGNDPAKYLNSPETPLFHKGRNLYGLYEAKQAAKSALPYLIVVEGYMDVVMLAQHGVREAVATLGTATTAEHLHLLFKQTNKVVFSFDGDRAGRSAAWRALEQALPEVYGVRECRFLFLPDGHDPDSLVQEIGAEAFRALVDGALPLTAFLLSELEKQVDLNSLEGRAKLVALAQPHLAKLKEGPLRELVLLDLAKRARLSPQTVERLTKQSKSPQTDAAKLPEETAKHDPSQRSTLDPNAAIALQILFEHPEFATHAQHLEQVAASGAKGSLLLVEVIEFFTENPEFKAAHLLQHFDGSRKGIELSKLARKEMPLSPSGAKQEFLDVLRTLRSKSLRRQAAAILESIQGDRLSAADLEEAKSLMAHFRSLLVA